MNARFDDPTAVLIRVPFFLDYPEDGDSKLRRKLRYLLTSQRVVVSYEAELFIKMNFNKIGYEVARWRKVTQDCFRSRFLVLHVYCNLLDGILVIRCLSTCSRLQVWTAC